MKIEFISTPGLVERDLQTIRSANESLEQMRLERIQFIDPTDGFIESKLSWKLATLRQPILYRVVALAESFALNWNSGNLVGAYLPARALIETCALLLELEHELRNYITKNDLRAIDHLLMNRLFATRDEEWVAKEPLAKAVSILTLIDRLDKRDLPGVRAHYNMMSEACHPNSLGHRLMFGKFDQDTGITTYSENPFTESVPHSLFATLILIDISRSAFEAVKSQVQQLASLQRE